MGPMETVLILTVTLVYASYASVIPCPGCNMEKDVNDLTLNNILSKILMEYKSEPQGTMNEDVKLVKVTKITAQVVDGMKYRYEFNGKGVKTHNIYECVLVFYSRPWLKEEKVIDFYCKPLSTERRKRSIMGGEIELNLESSTYLKELKGMIEEELTVTLKKLYTMEIVKFLKATQQVVAGTLTKASVEVALTNCVAGTKDKNCQIQPQEHEVCDVEIWEKPWIQFREITVKVCNKVPKFCAGCPREISPDDEEANKCLKRTLFNLNTKAHSSKQWKLVQTKRVEAQVVAGIKYIIEFDAEDDIKSSFTCKAVIVSQPWISNEPLLEDFKCVPNQKPSL